MTRRPAASFAASAIWLVLAALWLVWTVTVAAVWLLLALAGRRRDARRVARAFVGVPRPGRIAAWMPGRRRQPLPPPARPIRRMSSREKDGLLALVFARDGRACAECGCGLDPRLNHRHPQHPELHHLIAWSRCKHLPWANDPVNLVALCEPCHAPLGANKTTPRLEAKRLELWDDYRYQEAA